MDDARLAVRFAGPLVTLQDGGRTGYMRFGVPASGPMDQIAFAVANAALGNPHTHTAIEISLGGLIVECMAGEVTLAIAGGNFAIEHAAARFSGWMALTLRQGEELAIRGGQSGSWAYLAIAGNCRVDTWLGHTATLSTSHFGGGFLKAGQEILIEQPSVLEEREGEIKKPGFLDLKLPVRVVMGPQDKWFKQEAIDAFLTTEYSVTEHFNRMGMQLRGAPLPLNGALSIPSEPIVRGSVQVSGAAVPTILLADHQTTGGYPKIATVISPDINKLVQLRSGDVLSFQSITASDALTIVRDLSQKQTDYLSAVGIPKGTLSQRLMRENLISGIAFD